MITGAGRKGKLGYAIAERLVGEGYRPILHANTSLPQAREYAEAWNGFAVGGDLTVESDVEAMVGEAWSHFGRLDCLICAAAVWTPQPLETTTAELLRAQLDGNLVSSFLCAQRVGLKMVDQPCGGAIVFLGDWAHVRPYPQFSAYHLSKGAIDTMTRTLATELAQRNPGIRVNAVHPGPVSLPENLDEKRRKAAISSTLLKREGKPEHVAQAVSMLLANEFITGVTLPVDGGRTICDNTPFYADPEL